MQCGEGCTYLAAVGLRRLFRSLAEGSFQYGPHSLKHGPDGFLASLVLRMNLGTGCQQSFSSMLQDLTGLPLASPKKGKKKKTV